MNSTSIALIGFIIWYLVLYGGIVSLRVGLTLAGKRRANSFKPDGLDVSPFSARLCRAHANCYEAFPYLGGLMLLALTTDSTKITDSLALVMLSMRILQSFVHLLSTSVLAVQLRFLFFLIQLLIAWYWAVEFAIYFTA